MNILITGGASGLGEAITKKLAGKQENFVYFTYCRSESNAKLIESEFKNTKAFYVDFNDTGSTDNFAGLIESLNLDVLVNNAITGITKKHFHKIEAGEFLDSFIQNVIPVIKITKEVLTSFRKKKSGRIINILSTSIIDKPPIGWAEYTANKNYILSLSKSWAVENEKFNITSNCISPSFMLTGLNKDTDERMIEDMKTKSPTGKLLKPEDVALAVSNLIDSKENVNGINMIINSAKDVI